MFYLLLLHGNYWYGNRYDYVIFDDAEQLENFIHGKSAYNYLDDTCIKLKIGETIDSLYIGNDICNLFKVIQ